MNPTGRLELTWANKHLRLLSHGSDTYEWVEPTDWRVTEVRPLRYVETVGEPGSGNLLIEGDAAHLLDALLKVPELSAQYRGKVRLCYIDPPFNTEQAFVHYNDAVEHSIWLTMLRDRMMQIRGLLTADGSVWVHLDDSEVHRCRSVMDEVLGASNFLGTVIWQKADGPRNDLPNFSVDHDTLLVYGKSAAASLRKLERDEALNAIYGTPDGDEYPWYDDNPTAPSAHRNQTWVYAVQSPITGELAYPAKGRCWATKQETVLAALNEYAPYKLELLDDDERRAEICGVSADAVRKGVAALVLATDLDSARASTAARKAQGTWPEYIIRPKGTLGRKRPQPDTGANTRTLWFNSEVGHNREAKAEIKALFPGTNPFGTPKPERLLRKIIDAATSPGDIVLDCYAGSGTSAAVAHKMGRRWVTSELSESTLHTFTQPRLAKVVNGEDPGGITSTTTVEFVGDLPDGLAPADVNRAANFLKGLREHGIFDELPKPKRDQQGGPLAQVVALLKGHPEVQDVLLETMAKQMRAAAKTKKVETILWTGGGGFDVAKVAPSMFVEDDGHLFLADWAIGGALAEAVAAQVGYTFEMDGPFAGRKGRSRLAVLDGMLTCGVADFLVEQLGERETVLVIAQTLEPGVDEHLRKARAGSRARKVPRDLARRSALSGLKVRVRTVSKGVVGAQASDANDGNL